MTEGKDFTVVGMSDLRWPTSLLVPTQRFRLLVAADASRISEDQISRFATDALSNGVVYLCAWGKGCERLHDIFDKIVVEDDHGPRRFAGSTHHDVIMTTWHDDESLEEALDFLATAAVPTDGFIADSSFRVVLSVGRPDWAAVARQYLATAPFFA